MKLLLLLSALALSLYGQSGTVTYQVLGVPGYYCADAGSTDAYACAIDPPLTAYRTGTTYTFKANTANTGAASINLNSLGAVTIKTASGADLATGDIRAGQMVSVIYAAGPVMQMQSTAGNASFPTVLNVVNFGAKCDGVTNDTAAFTAAIAAVPEPNGAEVVVPAGVCLLDAIDIDKTGLTLTGSGYRNTILQRRTDTTENLITISAGAVALRSLKVQEDPGLGGAATNTGKLIYMDLVNDVLLDSIWVFFGYDQIYISHSDGIRMTNSVVEAARNRGLTGYQASMTTITDNIFYACGVVSGNASTAACIKWANDGGYLYPSYSITLANNYFNYAHYAGFIDAVGTRALSILGNYFHLAGTFNPGSKSDVSLTGVSQVTITGNTSVADNNPYIPGNRASKYVVDIDATSTYVKIVGNGFIAGTVGTINDGSGSADYISSTESESVMNGLTVYRAGAVNGQLTLKNAGSYHTGLYATSSTLASTTGWALLGGPNTYQTGLNNAVAIALPTDNPEFRVVSLDGSLQAGGPVALFRAYRRGAINAGSVTFANLPASPNEGDMIYCSACTVSSGACATGAGKATAVYNGTTWRCTALP